VLIKPSHFEQLYSFTCPSQEFKTFIPFSFFLPSFSQCLTGGSCGISVVDEAYRVASTKCQRKGPCLEKNMQRHIKATMSEHDKISVGFDRSLKCCAVTGDIRTSASRLPKHPVTASIDEPRGAGGRILSACYDHGPHPPRAFHPLLPKLVALPSERAVTAASSLTPVGKDSLCLSTLSLCLVHVCFTLAAALKIRIAGRCSRPDPRCGHPPSWNIQFLGPP
jgi:hypothetical protein